MAGLHKPGKAATRTGAAQGLVPRVRTMVVAVTVIVGTGAVVGHTLTSWLEANRARDARLAAQAQSTAALFTEFEPDELDARRFAEDAELRPGTAFAHRFFRRVANAMLGDQRITFVAVVDIDGNVLDQRPADATPAAALSPPSADTSVITRSIASSSSPRTLITMAPVSRGPLVRPLMYLAIGTHAYSPTVLSSATVWGFALGAGLVCVVVIAVGLGRLETGAFRQLRRLSHEVFAAAAQHSPRLAADNADELERIALGIEQLRTELEHADHRATRLQRSIDSTVARETRQISLQLKRAEREAEVDALTGLANRRFIEERLNDLLGDLAGRGVRLAVIMLDVDHFKPLNDTAGHAAGDEILRFVGELLRGSLREGDVAIRYGGDEFAVVLLDVSGEHARETAERLIRLFAQHVATMNLPTTVSLSAGIATLESAGTCSGENLLARADAALYQSKRAGRNTVHVARI